MIYFLSATPYLTKFARNTRSTRDNDILRAEGVFYRVLDGDIQFAPIYDFAPMKADPEMVTRLFKWGGDFELGGRIRFDLIVKALDDFCDPEELLAFLNGLAQRLVGVPERLKRHGCPASIMEFPAIGFRDVPNKLRNFGVTYD